MLIVDSSNYISMICWLYMNENMSSMESRIASTIEVLEEKHGLLDERGYSREKLEKLMKFLCLGEEFEIPSMQIDPSLNSVATEVERYPAYKAGYNKAVEKYKLVLQSLEANYIGSHADDIDVNFAALAIVSILFVIRRNSAWQEFEQSLQGEGAEARDSFVSILEDLKESIELIGKEYKKCLYTYINDNSQVVW